MIKVVADSRDAGSPGFNFLYISIKASSLVSEFSFSRVFLKCFVSPIASIISSSVSNKRARTRVVAGSFLVLSSLTFTVWLASVSNSIQAPLFGITVDEYCLSPLLSVSSA